MKSNGWSPTTAALQLFAHLDGEALNVALLMPREEREQWTAFARGLSDYLPLTLEGESGVWEDAGRLGSNRWGASVDLPGPPSVQAFPALGSHSSLNAGRRECPGSENDGDVADGRRAELPISTPEMGDPTRGMRPAGASRSSPPKPVVDLSDVGQQAVGRPLSVEAPEFSPALDTRTRGTVSVALP